MPKLNDIMAARPAEKRAQYTVQMIPYTQLIPNRENKYSLGEIEELANMIRLAGGIPEPLFARKRAPGEYELISGHRRRLAVIHLVEKLGLEQFRLVPVHLENLDDIMARITLYLTNAGQRNKTDHDRMIEVIGLTESLEALRTGTPEHQEKFRELTGLEPQFALANDIRAAVADKLGLSVTKTAQLKHITPKAANSRIQTAIDQYRKKKKKSGLESGSEQKKKELAKQERISIRDVEEKLESDSKEKGELHRQQSLEPILPESCHQTIEGHAKPPEAPVKTGHVLRVGQEEYDHIIRGEKAYKLTRNDQKFLEGHDLEFWCYQDGKFTGRKAESRISHMDEDMRGLEEGYCILGFQLMSWSE